MELCAARMSRNFLSFDMKICLMQLHFINNKTKTNCCFSRVFCNIVRLRCISVSFNQFKCILRAAQENKKEMKSSFWQQQRLIETPSACTCRFCDGSDKMIIKIERVNANWSESFIRKWNLKVAIKILTIKAVSKCYKIWIRRRSSSGKARWNCREW